MNRQVLEKIIEEAKYSLSMSGENPYMPMEDWDAVKASRFEDGLEEVIRLAQEALKEG